MPLAVGLAVTAACGSSSDQIEAPEVTTTTTVPSSTTTSAAPTSESPSPTSEAPAQAQTPVVAEGSACGPRGAVAVFADGAAAYCARLQYTDGAAWSRDPSLAPNPAGAPQAQPSSPQIGDQCIGADIGRTAVDANGTAIMCDNYQWVPNVGQEPRHPWADAQAEWADCLKVKPPEEC